MWTASTAARAICDFEDLVREADHIIFGLYPTALIQWFKTYGALLKPGCIFTDVSGVKTGLVEPVQALCPDGVEFIASHPMAGRETHPHGEEHPGGHRVGEGTGRGAGIQAHLHPDRGRAR